MEKFPRSHWCQIQLIFILNHVPSCSYSCSESDWLHTRQWAPSQTAQMPHAENTLKPDDILSAIYLPQVQDYVSSLELRPAFPFPWHYEISINKVYFFCSSYAHFISEGLQMCSVTKSVRGEQITGRFHVSLASVAENCLRSTIIDPQSDVFIPATWAETPLCIPFTSHVITEICSADQQQEGFFWLISSLMTTRVDIWGG